MSRIDEGAEHIEKNRNIGKMQTRGRFVQKKKNSFIFLPGRFRQVSGEFESLGLTAAQCGDRLTELQVSQSDSLEVPQSAKNLGTVPEEFAGFGNRHFQDIRGRQGGGGGIGAPGPNFKNFRAVTAAVAVGTPQVDIAQKLHFDVFETAASAGRAAAGTGIETEGTRSVSPFLRKKR